MKKIGCILTLLFSITLVQKIAAAEFEGTITLVKETMYDTTLFSFNVKNEMVRIDETNTRNEVIQSIIINLTTKHITALSPSQKLYTNIYKSRGTLTGDLKIFKTVNFKYIDGYKCYQWRVRNNTLDSEVSLWVCAGNFTFFSKVMDLLSKTQDYSEICQYFSSIPDNQGFFPILVVERTLLREEKSRMLVKSINPQEISPRLFEIPKDYKCLLN